VSLRPQTFLLLGGASRSEDICRIVDALEELPIEDGHRIEIHGHANTRTARQNRALWWLYGTILHIGGNTMAGWTKEELHEHFLGEYFGVTVKNIFGKRKEVPNRRSKNLSTAEFAKFVDSIYSYMASKGVVLPLPDRAHDWRKAA
jgi:hypothetical protein